ncbi:hypothetical protein WJX81_005567 [Elliptochloris bilobata]|uniref:Chromosome partition protein Smc n=1 Tax=Elliptochloris bilobata TaxID=381761 RepID=A0AAW1RLA1_9CHLO
MYDAVRLASGQVKDAAAWQAEVQRGVERLRAALPETDGDWRQDVGVMQRHHAALAAAAAPAQAALARIADEAEASLAQVEAREAALTAQVSGPVQRARLADARLARLHGDLADRRAALANTEDEAAQLEQEAEEARGELEARGSGLTDATPVLRCRAAIERLQGDLKRLDVRTGVLQAQLHQAERRRARGLAA